MGTVEAYVDRDIMSGRYHEVLTYIVEKMEASHEATEEDMWDDYNIGKFHALKAVREKMLEYYEGKYVAGSFDQEYKDKYLCSFERKKDK